MSNSSAATDVVDSDAATLSVRDLCTYYPTDAGLLRAVDHVSFDVRPGSTVGLVGESGSGKSTTIKSILGLHSGAVTHGEIRLGGRNLLEMPRRALRSVRGAEIGFVSQNPFGVLNPILTVADQFYDRFKAHRRGVTEAESRKAARGMLEAVGISASDRVLSGYAHELSGGMAQRVAIAMALILDPRLIIADEPTTALDVTVQKQILDLLRSLIAGSARSMLLVTHDLGVVAQYCDEVIVMYAGTVVESGPVETVLISPEHPYTDALIRSVPRRGYPIEALPGRAPSLLAQPVGCPLHDRCKHALDTCAIARPELEARSSGRMVRCNVDWKESA